jgi:TP901 family phage tail tape measure protein
MASLSDVIQIIINAEDNASGAIQNVGGAISGLARGAQSVTQPLADMADKLLIAEAAVVGIGAALVKTGVEEAGKFQSSFQFITTLFESSGESAQSFRQDILDYASDSTQSLDSITAALQDAIGSGVDYADSLGILSEAERLAVAQGASLDETTGLLVSTLNGYGLSMEQAATLSDQFSITIRDGKISAAELASQLSNVTPIAAAAGVGFDQVGSAIAVLTSQGYPAGQAITAVKSIIEGIIKPTGDAAKTADALGISFNAATLKSDGLQSILQKVSEATGGNVETMAKLFTTTEGLGGALALGGIGADKFKAELELMAQASGATETAFAKMGGTIESGAAKIDNALKVAFINLGTPLLDEFSGIQTGIANIFQSIGASLTDGGALRPITQALESLGVDVKAVVDSIAKNLPEALAGIDFSGVIGSFDGLGGALQDAFSAFFGDIDLTTVEGLRSAINTVVDSIETLTRVVSGIVGGLTPFIRGLGDVVREVNSADDDTKAFAGEVLGLAKGINEIAPAFAALGDGISAVGMGLQGLAAVQAIALFNSMGAAGAALATTLRALAIPLAAASAAVGAWTFAITQNMAAWEDYQARTQGAADATQHIGEVAEQAGDGLESLNARLGTSFANMDDFNKAADSGAIVWDKTRAAWVKAGTDLAAIDTAAISAGDSLMSAESIISQLPESLQALSGGGDALKTIGESADSAADGTEKLKTESGALVNVIRDGQGNITGYSQAIGATSTAMTDAAKKTEEATKKSDEFQIKMEEIASNERIKTIEFAVDLKVAQLETDMERVKATFASLDNSISSTGDVLGTLFGSLGDASAWDRLTIEDQIDRENDLREQSFKLQERLAKAEIARIEEQTRALARGDALIQIDGSGLAPELEAFMWQILKAIRVRANAEFQDYLLGMGAT